MSSSASISASSVSSLSVTEQARKTANLRLLQRTCSSDISDIVLTATHVVLYEYQKDTAWHKSNVEGSLFFVATCQASYQLIILNRHSADNFQMPVNSSMQLQHQDPYLIFRQQKSSNENNSTGGNRIRGIWFHNANERIAMATVLQQTVQRLKEQQEEEADAARHLYAPPPGTQQMQPHAVVVSQQHLSTMAMRSLAL